MEEAVLLKDIVKIFPGTVANDHVTVSIPQKFHPWNYRRKRSRENHFDETAVWNVSA